MPTRTLYKAGDKNDKNELQHLLWLYGIRANAFFSYFLHMKNRNKYFYMVYGTLY